MFDLNVGENGYAWWYLDAISDDHQYALTVIVFIGSVFSPYYVRSRKRAASNPRQHCAVNAILYGPKANRWSMTERASNALTQTTTCLTIGPSNVRLDDNRLRFQINEITVPIPRKLRGEIIVTLPKLCETSYELDNRHQHWWQPLAPHCRVNVKFEHPELQWQGNAYLDHNRGDAPIERGFRSWNWSRLHLENRDTLIVYDRELADKQQEKLILSYDSTGHLTQSLQGEDILRETALNEATLPSTTLWRMPRSVRCDVDSEVSIINTLEDTPFYSRSEIEGVWGGIRGKGVHESVSLTRFVKPIVQWMLPFRMPRRR